MDTLKIHNSDFIKIDAQGYNYEILEGSKKLLKSTLGVESEVEFTDIYNKQKLFSDVLNLLKKNRFDFIDFINLRRWNRENLNNYGQCVFGNAIFLKKPEDVLNLSEDKIIKYISICILYNKFDIINFILKTKKIKNDEKLKIQKNLQFFTNYSNKSRNIKKIASFFNRSIDYESEIILFQ